MSDWPDPLELAEKVERHRPIAIPWPTEDQCLPTAVAAVLRERVDDVPPRRYGQTVPQWMAEVAAKFGVDFEIAGPEELPPVGLEPWVAIVDTEDGTSTHAVACAGRISADPRYPRAPLGATCGLLIVHDEAEHVASVS